MEGVTDNDAEPLPSWFQPTAQVATGMVFTDDTGRILLVKPTYNDVWHLPGGVVEAGESPAAAAVREVKEELGLDVAAGRLLGVDYRPPTPGGRGSALRFAFDGGTLTLAQIEHIVLPPDEIREWKYVGTDELDGYVIPVLANRLRYMLAGHVYLEEGRPAE
jgi:ADP-ribose pyrophosphatase YjhB (NUDIX family)